MTQQKCVISHPMLSRVKELLRDRPEELTYEKIEADTGITVAWLTKFSSQNNLTEYAFSRIANLYEYLSGHKIEVI
jgi:hypothetical protein